MKQRKAVLGFYKRDGKTRPFTQSLNQLNQKKIIKRSNKLRTISPLSYQLTPFTCTCPSDKRVYWGTLRLQQSGELVKAPKNRDADKTVKELQMLANGFQRRFKLYWPIRIESGTGKGLAQRGNALGTWHYLQPNVSRRHGTIRVSSNALKNWDAYTILDIFFHELGHHRQYCKDPETYQNTANNSPAFQDEADLLGKLPYGKWHM